MTRRSICPRLNGGKDAANARYIFTKLDMLTRLLFEEDDVLLDRVIDDGDYVEPEYYVPIIPMISVNGCSAGIGLDGLVLSFIQSRRYYQ